MANKTTPGKNAAAAKQTALAGRGRKGGKKNQRGRLGSILFGVLVGLAAIAILGVTLPCFNSVAVLLPMLFPRIVIALRGALQSSKH